MKNVISFIMIKKIKQLKNHYMNITICRIKVTDKNKSYSYFLHLSSHIYILIHMFRIHIICMFTLFKIDNYFFNLLLCVLKAKIIHSNFHNLLIFLNIA